MKRIEKYIFLEKKYFFKFIEEFKVKSLYSQSSDFVNKRLKRTGV